MEFFDVLLQAGLMTTALVVYLIFIRKHRRPLRRNYVEPGWNYPLKWLVARYYAVRRWRASHQSIKQDDYPRTDMHDGWDSISVAATTPDGAALLLGVRKLCGRQPMAELTVFVKLADGTSYVLARHPDTAVGAWEDTAEGWSAEGLKIQVMIPELSLRIIYNGILTRLSDGVKQHVKFNFIWSSGSDVSRYPEDWSDQLAAHTLALEQWRDDDWPKILGKWEDGSWLQFGVVQGRFQSFDEQGAVDKSEYLRYRGVRERRWAPHGYQGLRRSVALSVISKDGTAVQIRGISYSNVLTENISGCVRHPDGEIHSITSTDFSMQHFCETPDEIPKVFSFNLGTNSREFRLVFSINADGGQLLSGVPYQQSVEYRSVQGVINGDPATGMLLLGYEAAEPRHPTVPLAPARALKWVAEEGDAPHCLRFKDRAAACVEYVGGKGASLALLASVQHTEGYKVPPGFCVTTRALEKHLEMNPELVSAIKEIEAANENYAESNFKDKCNKTTQLFVATAIAGDVKEDILKYLAELRIQAKDNGLEQRFAVRSSAIGEDSETLSAAGQNETILGCVSDDDVLRGVQKCWGSMFAFTSAYYRRQNGQPCMCGGAVVIQALVSPLAAGVMFSRHPDAGDPSRLLITANYGLGESVVSGTVEPDTVIVKRHDDGRLSIMKIELGSKTERITTSDDGGVTSQAVPESQRTVPCLSETEMLQLARLGVRQEVLWGKGRDIEWAVAKDGIYLLQARPITSLERWTEEELLHENDTPIMSDEDLVTFANCGEVMPKPMSPLGYDVMVKPLADCMMRGIESDVSEYDKWVIITHNRVAMALYSLAYRRPPKQIDIGVRMQEMALHGHKFADQHVLDTALHRRPFSTLKRLKLMGKAMLYPFLTSKWQVNRAKNIVKNMSTSTENKNSLEILEAIIGLRGSTQDISMRHMFTSSASSGSQLIAMAVLLEGRGIDFSQEQCSEIGTLLSSGDVLSAEVPQMLAKLARQIYDTGKMEEFRAQDPKASIAWLEQNLPDVHKNVLKFLDEHGYRAIMEFDIATKPWVLVPEELMKVLASMRPTEEEVKSATKTDKEVIASLKSPQKGSTRKILSWLLPVCRHMVRNREATKAQLILGVHKIRLMAITLGKKLVKEWYLPDPELVFYFREHELKKYYETRDPALLRKAIQRQQYYPKWSKLRFAETYTGWPEPMQVKGPSVTAGDVRIEATSVYGGEAIGRACVVKDLSEIHQLQQGDILVTLATDIGWSPYFPLLTGIVTELGGLISHGAVIAREYGLPCVVGATGATDMFQTGDTVRIIGHQGILEKVSVAADDEQSKQT